ncbi:MAG: thiol reductant ABC exporter subunit CydD [Selenomonadales bacterium]|nr:thiol reductant ABC exporter subunit CydD [Selenomonadales bacterium]
MDKREGKDQAEHMEENTKGMHRRLMKEVRAGRGKLILLLVLGAVSACAIAASSWAIANITNEVFLNGAGLDTLYGWFALLFGALVLRGVLSSAEGCQAGRITSSMTAHFRRLLFDALHRGGPAYLSGEAVGELASSALRGVGQVALYYAHFLPQAARTAVIVPLMVMTVAPFDLSSAGLLLITIPLLPIFMMLIGLLAKRESRRQYHAMGRLGAHLYDVIDGLGTLKLFGRSREQAAVVERMSKDFSDATLRVLRVAFLSAFILELVTTMATAVIAVSIGLRLVWGNMVFLDAFFVLLLIPECYLPLRKLGAQFHTAVVSLPAAARLFSLIDQVEDEGWTGSQRTRIEGAPRMVFDDVWYRYPQTDGDIDALCGASLVIEAGKTTAIVGKSGSGKTTMLKLASGLTKANSGRVLLGDAVLTDLDEAIVREQIAYVAQFPHMFRMTVADNIALAGKVDMARVREAARQAGADDFIERLPDGYDTFVGDGGHALSGGEVRRIALARAFYQGGSVLLLDEWTEGLDALTEARVQSAMDKLTVGKTVVIVAHRLETASRADYVAVMEDGRIAEYGSPDELLAKGGRYAQMMGREEAGV